VRPFAQALGEPPVVMLPNHGAITSDPSIQSALFRMMLLEDICQRNISVASASQGDRTYAASRQAGARADGQE
jgi:ribulose-5-phosphate 4-epimerase/fuculose-1-phosphate aldolase